MAFEKLVTRLMAPIAKSKTRDYLVSHYSPPAFGDIFHDGLVSSGQTWGGILGGAAGTVGGEVLAGPYGAAAGSLAGAGAGALAGGWAAHGAYREGQLIKEILTHPENWTVDAAGAIVPVTGANDVRPTTGEQASVSGTATPITASSRSIPQDGATAQPNSAPPPPLSYAGFGAPQRSQPSVFATGAPPSPYLPPAPRDKPGGILGMLIDAGHIGLVNPDQPPAGGLLGLIQDYLRNDPGARR